MSGDLLAGLLPCDGTFDIECANWDRFAVAATYDREHTKIHRSVESLVSHMRKRGGVWWAHCGGQYDVLPIADLFDREGKSCQIDYPRSRVTRLVSGSLVLRDSFALMPFSLEIVAAIAEMPCPRLPWACTCSLGCGGYCQIGKMASRGDPDLEEYVGGDCRVLYRALERLAHFARDSRIDLKGTIGASAWATAKRQLQIPDADISPHIWGRLSSADHGGRQVLARPMANGPGTHRDISSAYPAALARVSLPDGKPTLLGRREATAALVDERPGVYCCRVTIPDDVFLPALPVRIDTAGRERVVYPTGTLTSTWCLPELNAALERGCRIERVDHAITYPQERVIFSGLMRHWYGIRRKVGKKTALGRWMRELANSLTGKFSERPERMTVRMHPSQIKFCHRVGVCRWGCTGACGAYVQLDRWGHIWGQPYYRTADSGHLQWAIYLKAATRIAWLAEAERHGRDLVSGHTDSIWTTSRKRSKPEGTALGAWETKCTWSEWEARSAACYRYRDLATGKVVIRASGAAGMTDEEWNAGRYERSRGVETLLTAAEKGNGLFHRRTRAFTLPGSNDLDAGRWFGDRMLDGSGKLTHPAPIEVHRGKAEAIARRQKSRRSRA